MTVFRQLPPQSIGSNRRLIYRLEEHSFDVEPSPSDGYTSFQINTVNVEVNRRGKIVSVWGYCPQVKWIKSKLMTPTAGQGDLYCHDSQLLKHGVSIKLSEDNWPVMVDRQTGWVCMSKERTANEYVEILPSIIIGLDSAKHIVELWLNPIEE